MPLDPCVGADGITRPPDTWSNFDRESDFCNRSKDVGPLFVVRGPDDLDSLPLAVEAIKSDTTSCAARRVRGASERMRRLSVDSQDLLSPEDLGVAFAMRVASKPLHTRRKTLVRLKSAFTKVIPDEPDELCRKRPNQSQYLGRLSGGDFWRRYFKQGVLNFKRPQKLLMVSGAISGFYVMAGLAVEPYCIPTEAGTLFQRIGSRHHGVSAVFSIIHLVMSAVYTITVFGARTLRVLTPKPATNDPIVGDLTIPKEEVRVSKWWHPTLFVELLALAGTFAEIVHAQEAEAGLPTAAQWAMLLQVFKCWRFLRSETVGVGAEENGLFWGLARVLCSLAVFAHVMVTVLMVIGVHEASWGGRSWILDLQGGFDHPDGCFVLYVEGWYFAVLSLTSVGYGDLLVTPLERGINSFFLLFSQLYTAKVCADLTWITSTHNHWEAQHQAQRAQAWVALQHMQVPRVLAERVIAFQTYLATVHREDLMQPAFEGLSSNLMMELRLCTYRKLVLRAPFLREQSRDVMTFIVGALTDSVFLPGDVIVRSGDKGRELFFMRRGKAKVYVGGEPPIWGTTEPVAAYVVGNYFGELGMLTGHPRKAWIMAEVYSVVSVLPYSAVETLMQHYPGAFTSLVQAMVGQYDLKSSMTWDEVAERMEAKYRFADASEAFNWFLSNSRNSDEEELGARAFEESLMRLKVPSLDRKILWAEMDQDNSGFVTLDEFREKLFAHLEPIDRSWSREWSKGSSGINQQTLCQDPPVPWRNPSISRTEVSPTLGEVLHEVRMMHRELAENKEQTRKLTVEVSNLKRSTAKDALVSPSTVSDLPAGMHMRSQSMSSIEEGSLPGVVRGDVDGQCPDVPRSGFEANRRWSLELPPLLPPSEEATT